MSDYHHGDLRKGLLVAAHAVLNEKGIHGLSLRACAAKAGVSHAAPTHHFKSLSGLLTELAVIAFGEFTEALRQAYDGTDTRATLQERLQTVGNAYVQFALREPELFKLIFSSPLPDQSNEQLKEASGQAYGELTRVVKPLCDAKGITDSAIIEQAELLVWSTIHGYAHLSIKQQDTYGACDDMTAGMPPMAILGTLFTQSK
jgi:AcrR family transcriptional regulator